MAGKSLAVLAVVEEEKTNRERTQQRALSLELCFFWLLPRNFEIRNKLVFPRVPVTSHNEARRTCRK